jgi:hypothetical protein
MVYKLLIFFKGRKLNSKGKEPEQQTKLSHFKSGIVTAGRTLETTSNGHKQRQETPVS